MLQNIRDKSQGWITWVIVIVVCFSFGLWGIGNYIGTGSSEPVAAEVNSTPIYQRELINLQRAALENLQSTQGKNIELTESLATQLQQEALSQLITMQVALQGAMNEKFHVSNQQVYDVMAQIPYLQEQGQFSNQRFSQVLRMMNQTEQQYLDNIRGAILVDQVKQSLVDSNFILPNELTAMIALLDQKRSIDYFIIPLSRFEQVSVPENEIKNYYDEHKESYKTPEKISLSYVELSKADVAKQLNLAETDSNVEKEFAIKSEELANKSYEDPDTLENVSKALQLPIQTTPLISKNTPADKSSIFSNADVLKAAFSDEVLSQGYNSDVISLNNGNQLVVRLNKHIPQQPKSFSEAKAAIQQLLLQAKKEKEVMNLGDVMLQQIEKNLSASVVAKENGFQLMQKENIVKSDKELDFSMMNAIFKLPIPAKNKISADGVLLPSGDYAILVLTKVEPGDAKKLTESQLKTYRTQLALQNGLYDYELYLKSLNDKSKIKIYKNSEE